MVKLFGYKLGGRQNVFSSFGQQQSQSPQNQPQQQQQQRLSRRRKKRQSPPSVLTPEIIRERYPMYQYAIDEFSQAVPPGTSNSDGVEVYHDQRQKLVTTPTTMTPSARATPTGSHRSKNVPNSAVGNINSFGERTHSNQSSSSSDESKIQRAQEVAGVTTSSTSGSWTTIATSASQGVTTEFAMRHLRGASRSVLSSSQHQQQQMLNVLSGNGMGYVSSSSEPDGVASSRSSPNQHAIPNNTSLNNQQRTIQELNNVSSPTSVPYQIDFEARSNRSSNSPHNVQSSSEAANTPLESVTEGGVGVSSGSGVYPSMESVTAATADTNKSTLITQFQAFSSPFDYDMTGSTYEEFYGDAYTGGRLKYIYPSGYQSMRPRSCPWKLSIAVCILFTWLSVFIVGHCSEQVPVEDSSGTNDYNSGSNTSDGEDSYRWCGSRPLYLMWVVSMLITFLSAAYCSIIGYIKVRDFAVANSRSQPPGVIEGKSDYYVRINDVAPNNKYNSHNDAGTGPYNMNRTDTIASSTATSPYSYHPTIYQSDGTPQFWGSHIYRPTQAAVAVTNRN